MGALRTLLTFPGAALFGLGLCWLLGPGGGSCSGTVQQSVLAHTSGDLAGIDGDDRAWTNHAAIVDLYHAVNDSTPHGTGILLFADDLQLGCADLEVVAGAGLDLSVGVSQDHSVSSIGRESDLLAIVAVFVGSLNCRFNSERCYAVAKVPINALSDHFNPLPIRGHNKDNRLIALAQEPDSTVAVLRPSAFIIRDDFLPAGDKGSMRSIRIHEPMVAQQQPVRNTRAWVSSPGTTPLHVERGLSQEVRL